MICNQQVVGSSPIASSNQARPEQGVLFNKTPHMGEFPSGQRGQTVNLLLYSFDGPNPSSPTKI